MIFGAPRVYGGRVDRKFSRAALSREMASSESDLFLPLRQSDARGNLNFLDKELRSAHRWNAMNSSDYKINISSQSSLSLSLPVLVCLTFFLHFGFKS